MGVLERFRAIADDMIPILEGSQTLGGLIIVGAAIIALVMTV